MTTTITIIFCLAWCYTGLASAIYWENHIKRASGNTNQTWCKHQVTDLNEYMFYGIGSFLAGYMRYKNETKR